MDISARSRIAPLVVVAVAVLLSAASCQDVQKGGPAPTSGTSSPAPPGESPTESPRGLTTAPEPSGEPTAMPTWSRSPIDPAYTAPAPRTSYGMQVVVRSCRVEEGGLMEAQLRVSNVADNRRSALITLAVSTEAGEYVGTVATTVTGSSEPGRQAPLEPGAMIEVYAVGLPTQADVALRQGQLLTCVLQEVQLF